MKFKNQTKEINKYNGGYTLIELLISVLLLTIIISAFLYVFVYATRNNISSGQIVDKGYVAQTLMEDIISYNDASTTGITGIIDAMTNDGFSHYKVEGTTIDHTFKKNDVDGYYIQIELTEKAYATSEELVKVDIGVYKDSSCTELLAALQNIITI